MRTMQHEARSLIGGLGHLVRGRPDIAVDHALLAQGMHRPTHEHFEAAKEVLRYAWSTADYRLTYGGPSCTSLELSSDVEPRRPFDEAIEYGLYGMSDAAHAVPGTSVANSKSMGGYGIMMGGALIEWRAYRFHTIIPSSTHGEMLGASRLAPRLVYHRRIAQFLGIPQDRPTPLFTDNDGVWSLAKDTAPTTSMVYIIRHVRLLQQMVERGEIAVFQVDGRLNPSDAFTKYLDKISRKMHYLFMMGKHREAREFWRSSSHFKNFKPKKIVPVPSPPISLPSTVTAALSSRDATASSSSLPTSSES